MSTDRPTDAATGVVADAPLGVVADAPLGVVADAPLGVVADAPLDLPTDVPEAVRGRAHCPFDDWSFDPRYTDGVCPLCGWRPPGPAVRPPVFSRLDWFWPLVGLLVVVSVIMGVLVVLAYNRA